MAQAKSRDVTVSIVPLAWRERATSPGSMANKKARMSAGLGLILSLKKEGTNTNALPTSAGIKRARKFVVLIIANKMLVSRM